jgi:hypothetical protein
MRPTSGHDAVEATDADDGAEELTITRTTGKPT